MKEKKKKIWTVKEIVEDFNNHQDYKLHSSDRFIPINETVSKEEIYQYAINHWGEELQLGMLSEEIGELFIAINRFRRGRITDKDKIAEEIADVVIMLEQLAFMFKIDNKSIEGWKTSKLEKLESMVRNKTK